jgi:PilZ domain-containing protein
MSAQGQLQPAGCKRRDERYRVLIRATMRAGARPVNVCIRDVSLRGICVVTARPPARGTVVELSGPTAPIVGEVIWASERRFGVSVGGRIDLPRLLAQRSSEAAPHEVVPLPAYARGPAPKPRSADEHRSAGQAMQFLFVVLLAVAAAALIGDLVYENLATATDRVSAAMRAGN